jgi:SpoVK/Ycf46/Vps4 family AAA+-type ATPase
MDPAFLRRFAYALELPALGPGQRARVLRRHLGDAHQLAPADVDAVARRFHASPAQIEGAVRTARLLGGAGGGTLDRASLERVLAPSEKLLTGADPMRRRVFDPAHYDVAAASASDDLAGVAERLASWQPGDGPGVSLCLYGPPGTGKTEYVHYLAHRMGRPVIEHRVSDLLSKWVGETEQRIAAAFTQAEADDAVLLFDEADTFLRDRRRASAGWERSQTNELLQQLERFRGIVAVTTNLREELDAASLRRFILKLEFRALSPAQALRLFRSALGPHLAAPLRRAEETLVGEALSEMDALTPGDFAAVARRCAALRLRCTPAELVKALEAELAVKPGARRAAGF